MYLTRKQLDYTYKSPGNKLLCISKVSVILNYVTSMTQLQSEIQSLLATSSFLVNYQWWFNEILKCAGQSRKRRMWDWILLSIALRRTVFIIRCSWAPYHDLPRIYDILLKDQSSYFVILHRTSFFLGLIVSSN